MPPKIISCASTGILRITLQEPTWGLAKTSPNWYNWDLSGNFILSYFTLFCYVIRNFHLFQYRGLGCWGFHNEYPALLHSEINKYLFAVSLSWIPRATNIPLTRQNTTG